MIVTTLLLFEFSNHSASLVVSNFLSEVSLHDIDSATSQNISIWRRLNQTLSIVVHERFIFVLYDELSVHTRELIENNLLIDRRLENIRLIDMIR